MRSYKSHTIQVHHPDSDELVTEPVPEGGGATRVLSFLVSVGEGKNRYNFLVPRPRGGVPKFLLLGDRLLQFKITRNDEPGHVVYHYEEVQLVALAVRDATPVTYPEREGPARPMFEWDHPE